MTEAAGDDEYEEIVVPNGDFESGETVWKFEGDNSDDMLALPILLLEDFHSIQPGSEPNSSL